MTVSDLMETYVIPEERIVHERCRNTVWDGDERRSGLCGQDRGSCEDEGSSGNLNARCDREFADAIYELGRDAASERLKLLEMTGIVFAGDVLRFSIPEPVPTGMHFDEKGIVFNITHRLG
ncbi:MAG: hypothetical protein GF344_04515 [Chitinivibrionales bacterium]|nr:hypothetical protein [Chitinivibrionales bacterium]